MNRVKTLLKNKSSASVMNLLAFFNLKEKIAVNCIYTLPLYPKSLSRAAHPAKFASRPPLIVSSISIAPT